MDDYRGKCIHKNSEGECPVFEVYQKCSEIKECPLGEEQVMQDYNQNKYGVGVNEVKIEDFGYCSIGKYQKNPIKWPDVPTKYLEYLLNKECYTSQENKNKAAKVLAVKGLKKGQLESDLLKDPAKVKK